MKPGKNIAEPRERRTGHVLLLMFVLLATGLVTAGWFFYRNYAPHYRAEVERELSTLANLKTDELVQWRYPDSNLMAQALRYPPVTLLPKPVDNNVLLRTVRQVLHGTRGDLTRT